MRNETHEKGGVTGGRVWRATILVVEDEASLLSMIKTLLETANFRVLEAMTATDALQVWDDCQGEVDLLLTDLVLPEGFNGQELARQLKSKRPSLAVIYTSGYLLEMAAQTGEPLIEGVNFLQKPYRPRVLVEAVSARIEACEELGNLGRRRAA